MNDNTSGYAVPHILAEAAARVAKAGPRREYGKVTVVLMHNLERALDWPLEYANATAWHDPDARLLHVSRADSIRTFNLDAVAFWVVTDEESA